MEKKIPLAQALRPASFAEFAGQTEAMAKIRPHLGKGLASNLLLHGPPGCGKSSLALLIAKESEMPYGHLSAPQAGLSDLRKLGKPLLVLDEIHRLSKAQQDYFLPLLESGELILIATTTEKPQITVTPQLLSRMHAVRLSPLSREDLAGIAERGLERMGIPAEPGLVSFACDFSDGDARKMLSVIEALPGCGTLDPGRLRDILPERLIAHGDRSHYTLISALIKSIRKGAVQAALYWLAALLEAGEDPAFVCRRLVISAAEDIGLAEPGALPMAQACMGAVERTGMPEAAIIMGETVLYLALCPKSRSACAAISEAMADIRENGLKAVPGFLQSHCSPGHLDHPASEYLPEGAIRAYRPSRAERERKMVRNWKAFMMGDGGKS